MTKTLFLIALLACVFVMGQTRWARGYVLEGQKWPNGNITMDLELSSATVPYPEQFDGGFFPTYGLQDGSGSWNNVAQDALAEWNQYLENVQFASNENDVTPASPDGINSVFFDSTAFGSGFGSDALAVTIRWYIPSTEKTTEADVVVNSGYEWDSYRGNLQPDGYGGVINDLRRVLDHEFGHVLGLDHPDLAGQTVVAIMNSTISDLDHIEVDDINGAMFLYGEKAISEPITVVANPSGGGTVTGNGNFQLGSTQTLTATPAPGYDFVEWDDGTTNPTRSIMVPLQGGTYTATFAPALDAWTEVDSDNTIIDLNTILYVNGTFMVFGDTGFISSADGVTWANHTATVTSNYNPVSVAYHNGTFVSTGGSGAVWTSSDGLNWTSRQTTFTADNFNAVTYANGLFVAVGGAISDNGLGSVMTSPDGVTWTLQTQGVPTISGAFTDIIYANGMFVAVGATIINSAAVMTSPDGITWTATELPFYYTLTSITYGEGKFVACNYTNIYTSNDAVNWTQQASQSSNYIHMAYGDGTFLAASAEELESSPDGITWTERNPLTSVYYPGDLTYGNGRFVADEYSGIYASGSLTLLTPAVLPAITSGATARGSANALFYYQMTAANAPLAYNAVGLPDGLSVDAETGAITGTPTSAGTYPVELFATNDAGSGAAALTITVTAPATPESFGNWTTLNQVSGGATDTPAGDGVPNLLKYVYDLTPTGTMDASDRGALPILGMTASKDGLTLTFRQNKALTGYLVSVETSTDMVSWSTPANSSVLPTGQYDTLTGDPIMQATVPITANAQFIRLSVSPQ